MICFGQWNVTSPFQNQKKEKLTEALHLKCTYKSCSLATGALIMKATVRMLRQLAWATGASDEEGTHLPFLDK